MLYSNYLAPRYAHQKDFYNKAQYSCLDDVNYKTYTLYSDNINYGFLAVAKIVIDKKHPSKNRYYITSPQLFDKLTYKHICDFIYQFYEHKTTRNKIIKRNHFIKSKLFQYALQFE